MSRIKLLNKILNMSSSVFEISNELNQFGWDTDEELVNLTRQHILNVLKKYQEGSINEAEIEEWANLIEGREDIGREKFYEMLINQVLYELANPYLTEQLNKDRAIFLIDKMMLPN